MQHKSLLCINKLCTASKINICMSFNINNQYTVFRQHPLMHGNLVSLNEWLVHLTLTWEKSPHHSLLYKDGALFNSKLCLALFVCSFIDLVSMQASKHFTTFYSIYTVGLHLCSPTNHNDIIACSFLQELLTHLLHV